MKATNGRNLVRKQQNKMHSSVIRMNATFFFCHLCEFFPDMFHLNAFFSRNVAFAISFICCFYLYDFFPFCYISINFAQEVG